MLHEQQEMEQMVLDSVDKFLEAEVRPVAHKLEQADEYPQQIVDKMKELGLFGCIIDPEYGGMGLSASTYAKVI
ncbi:MAG TPA: acyl-CoA dehydrogenase family protein, partial [Usitatibacter sp.]|nr:acyl-CoA dehydrogenase family protein [Usitatibacter sp.]